MVVLTQALLLVIQFLVVRQVGLLRHHVQRLILIVLLVFQNLQVVAVAVLRRIGVRVRLLHLLPGALQLVQTVLAGQFRVSVVHVCTVVVAVRIVGRLIERSVGLQNLLALTVDRVQVDACVDPARPASNSDVQRTVAQLCTRVLVRFGEECSEETVADLARELTVSPVDARVVAHHTTNGARHMARLADVRGCGAALKFDT